MKLLLVFLSTFSLSAQAKILGPSLKYDVHADFNIDVESLDENVEKTEVEIEKSSVTMLDLRVPVAEIGGGNLVVLTSYIKDEFTFTSQAQEPNDLVYESMPLGAVWIEKGESDNWFGVYRAWTHPSGDYRAMHQAVIGRSVSADFLKFGSYNKVNARALVKFDKYPEYQSGLLGFQAELTDDDSKFLKFSLTTNGPTSLILGKWNENSKLEYGFKVFEINGQTSDSENWQRGWDGLIYGSYAQRISGIIYASFSAGAKIISRSFNDIEEDESNERHFTKWGTPFVSLAVETWIDVK